MKLKRVELDYQWPAEVSFSELRRWLMQQLTKHGEPLRWAITDVRPSCEIDCFRCLKVEAVLIISDS